MAFTQDTLAKTSSGYSHIISGQNWTYTSTTDTLANILVDGYFDAIVALVQVGEVFQVKDSTNEVELIEVSAINPTAPRVATKPFVGSGSIPDGSVTLPKLASGISPAAVIKFSFRATTAGGGTIENIPVAGALATDDVFVTIKSTGVAALDIREAEVVAETVNVTFSADPLAATVLYIQVTRIAT